MKQQSERNISQCILAFTLQNLSKLCCRVTGVQIEEIDMKKQARRNRAEREQPILKTNIVNANIKRRAL